MEILIFGATGGTGLELVRQAIPAGHRLTAFVRNPQKIQAGKGLRVVVGDATKSDDVAKAFDREYDAVVSALGGGAKAAQQVCSTAIEHILRYMQEVGIARLIAVSSLGVEPEYMPPLFRYVVLPYFLQKAHDDLTLMETYIRRSLRDWTLVRPPRLTDKSLTGQYRVTTDYAHDLPRRVSRADLAHFILKCLTERSYVHELPTLGY
ncbi:Putative NADH-flavin reductase [Catalinimonas alkaloidigena]|uniref:Putative NADH-flavin reductase n=1 Tax=Catalinimonas alkaloidigena TaxID=1075417 RepID=A0A1G9AYK3_9BACT|nr:SDR family oxidoreductase [Catalinimonas alkaloidigena]SDK32278.1 Putative NADH-flavin reductase [Catalinimonas alkaloidigena]